MILVLLFVTATFRPAQPAVGDLITVEFEQPVTLDASPAYEIVSQRGNRAVIRTFEPKPIALSGRAGDVRFRNLVLPVRSVLKPQDDMQPAPLKPPMRSAMPRAPWIAIGIAAAAAVAVWTAAWLLARRDARRQAAIIPLAPAEQFRATVAALRRQHHGQRWAALADATRLYLSSLSPALGKELTSQELLCVLSGEAAAAVAEVLRQGDLEKFSPWGAPPRDFESVADRALSLIPVEQEEAAA